MQLILTIFFLFALCTLVSGFGQKNYFGKKVPDDDARIGAGGLLLIFAIIAWMMAISSGAVVL